MAQMAQMAQMIVTIADALAPYIGTRNCAWPYAYLNPHQERLRRSGT